MLKPQRYYRLVEKSNEISLVKIYLAQRVIYLKEFYLPELVHHYYKTLVPGIVDRKRSNIFLFTGPKGTGKTSFVQWIIRGIHDKRQVIFLDHTDCRANRILFLDNLLADDPNRIIIFEMDGLSKRKIAEALTIANKWADEFSGVKILCLKEGDFHGHLAAGDYPFLRVLPFFTALPVELVNKVFTMMGMRRSATHEMTHSEIFDWVASVNQHWKSQQQ